MALIRHARDERDQAHADVIYGALRYKTPRERGTCLFWVRPSASRSRHQSHATHTPPTTPTSQTVPNVAAGFNVPRDVYYGEPALDAPAAASNEISPGRRARVAVESPSRRAARLE